MKLVSVQASHYFDVCVQRHCITENMGEYENQPSAFQLFFALLHCAKDSAVICIHTLAYTYSSCICDFVFLHVRIANVKTMTSSFQREMYEVFVQCDGHADALVQKAA